MITYNQGILLHPKVVPPFASISEERITVRKGEDVELLCVNSRSHDEVVWVTPETCKDDNVYIEKDVSKIGNTQST